MMSISAACGCSVGDGREHNEDNFYFHKKHLTIPNKALKNPIKCKENTENPVAFAVFDGMGGASKGEVASKIAAEVFSKEFKVLDEIVFTGKEFMLRTCEKMNTAVNSFRKENQLSTMGTTFAAVYFDMNEVVAANVGDSKIFRIRDSKMHQLSEDHTDANIMASVGINKKSVLLQYIGVPQTELTIDPYVSKGDIKSCDIFVLCTDGVTDTIGTNELFKIIISKDDVCDAVRDVMAQININNGSDNATIIVIKCIDRK